MKSNSAALVGRFPFSAHEELSFTAPTHDHKKSYFVTKRVVDLAFAVAVLPLLAALALFLLVANPFLNPGSLFFRQVRMGQDGKAFTMWKFRTMTGGSSACRPAHAPLDEHRITPLGRLLRRSKLDELPNVLNIFMGDMSLVGPRPDAFDHAKEYIARVPHYRKRFTVRPGITGLAQVRGGYADSARAVRRKARYDSFYIRNSSLSMDLYVISSTFSVMLSGLGQR